MQAVPTHTCSVSWPARRTRFSCCWRSSACSNNHPPRPAIFSTMSMIKMRVSDISGSRVNEVEAPDDVAVNRLLVVLIERLNLPLNSPDGQLMSYKLHHRRTGSQLLDSQTLG